MKLGDHWNDHITRNKENKNKQVSSDKLTSCFPTGGGGGDHTPPEITCPSSKTIYADYQGQAYVYYNLPVALDGNKPDGVT